MLELIPVENEKRDGYDRDLFIEGLDADADGCPTRAEVLIRDSLVPPQLDFPGCQVSVGEWLSVYDAVTVTDPALLQVDHVVSLKEAWDSGAWQWDDARRSAYANDLVDPRTLRAVTIHANGSKGEADPSNWLPTNDAFVCAYLSDWTAIKARWGLSMDQSEAGRVRNVLTADCPNQLMAPWPPIDPWVPPTTLIATTSTVVAVQPLVSVSVPVGAQGCDASYPGVCIPSPPPYLDCRDVPFRRFTVLPPDPHEFDGNGDGVGCEG